MDPSNFVRVVINNLAIKFPSKTKTLTLDSSFFCKIKLAHFPSQFAPIPADPYTLSGSVCFTLTRPDIDGLVSAKKPLEIKMDVYSRTRKGCGYGFGSSRKLLGRVSVPLPLENGITHMVVKNEWVKVGERKRKSEVYLHLTVKANPDPRFVFELDSEPECSPQVFQVQNQESFKHKQPVFSCKFGFGFKYNRKSKKERKGWSITIHDLSGSPVATASMVTPFVPSPGSGRVSQSSPGAWLILRPGGKKACWVPWGRLEAWSDGPSRVGYRLELDDGITLAQSKVPAGPGAKFIIDTASGLGGRVSPAVSLSSMDLGSSSGSSSESESGFGLTSYNGFVMSSRAGGAVRVEVGSQHVTCTEDAAIFVALAAAMEACRPFSHKLRKQLRHPTGEFVV